MMMVKELAESISSEQLPMLMKALTPEQQITLIELMKATQGDEDKDKNKSTNGTS